MKCLIVNLLQYFSENYNFMICNNIDGLLFWL